MRSKPTIITNINLILLSIVFIGIFQMFAQVEKDSTADSENRIEDLVGSDSTYILKLENNGRDFIVHFKMTKILDENGDYNNLQYFIEFRNLSDSSMFQTVIDTVAFCLSVDFKLIDINLDGFLDIQLVSGSEPAYADKFYHFWIYDRKKNKYYLNEEYSQICGEYDINGNNKTITCSYRFNCSMCISEDIYKVSNRHLKLIESSSQSEMGEDEDGHPVFKTTIEKLVNGKMKVVETILPK